MNSIKKTDINLDIPIDTPLDIDIAILAGGASTRMGIDKALAALDSRPVVSHVIAALEPLGRPVFIVGGGPAMAEAFGLPASADQYPVKASLVGVYSALAASRAPWCFVAACDMPFLTSALVELLAARADGFDAVIPVSGKGIEPLSALYSRNCMAAMRASLDAGRYSIREPLKALRVRYVEADELAPLGDLGTIFFNVNTPAQLEEAGRIAGCERRPRHLPLRQAPLVCFVGRKDSGKTTFIEKLVAQLAARGLHVAFIKHDVHGFDMDRQGTDTDRVARAGARTVIISSPDRYARLESTAPEKDLADLRRDAGPADLVIAEGFKSSCADRIEVSRRARSQSLAVPEEELVAVISDRPDAATRVPLFALDDVEGVAAFLAARYGLKLEPASGSAGGEAWA